jgi:hypothetical protein
MPGLRLAAYIMDRLRGRGGLVAPCDHGVRFRERVSPGSVNDFHRYGLSTNKTRETSSDNDQAPPQSTHGPEAVEQQELGSRACDGFLR